MEIALIQAALPYALRSAQIAAAVACSGLLWTGVKPLVWWPGAPLPQPLSQVAAPPASDHGAAEYAVIGGRNLFKPQELPQVAAPEPAPVIEKSQLALRLVGTLASASPGLSFAVLEENSKPEATVVAVGDAVSGAKIVRIEQRRVVVEHDGRLESIEIDLDPNAPPSEMARRRAETGELMMQNRGGIPRLRRPGPAPKAAALPKPASPPATARARRPGSVPGMIPPGRTPIRAAPAPALPTIPPPADG